MIGTRVLISMLVIGVMIAPAVAGGGGLFSRKGKSDARVKQLAEILRTETDERKRLAAIAELKEADPRSQVEVIPALVATLQRDSSPQARADAAEALAQFKVVFTVAGAALEAAAESDPSTIVRGASRQALWEYHLAGYRTTKLSDGILGQTVEPPIARPAAQRPVLVDSRPISPVSFPLANIVHFKVNNPANDGKISSTPIATLQHPVEFSSTALTTPRVIFTSAPPMHLNLTAEPPLAKPVDPYANSINR